MHLLGCLTNAEKLQCNLQVYTGVVYLIGAIDLFCQNNYRSSPVLSPAVSITRWNSAAQETFLFIIDNYTYFE